MGRTRSEGVRVERKVSFVFIIDCNYKCRAQIQMFYFRVSILAAPSFVAAASAPAEPPGSARSRERIRLSFLFSVAVLSPLIFFLPFTPSASCSLPFCGGAASSPAPSTFGPASAARTSGATTLCLEATAFFCSLSLGGCGGFRFSAACSGAAGYSAPT